MNRSIYDSACHILRNLSLGLQAIHRRCIGCDLGVLTQCEELLKKAEQDLDEARKRFSGGD